MPASLSPPSAALTPRLAALVVRFRSVLALAVLVGFLSLATDSFWSERNLQNVLRQIAVNLCLSIGMTLVVLTGGIDLSVGSTLALAGAVTAGLATSGLRLERWNTLVEFTPAGAIVAGIATGLLVGLANGLAVTTFRLPPFVATLGMLSIARGLTMLWTGGNPIHDLGPVFAFLGNGRAAGVPMLIVVAGLLAAVLAVLAGRTRFGRGLYAVGGNVRAATVSGLPVASITRGAYLWCGALAGVAGVLLTSRLNAATPDAGVGYELDAIAAVVIGGASLSGGRGTIAGTVLGCLLIGVLNVGLVLLDVSPYWQQVIKGLVILAAVALDRATSGRPA
jgi:ribose transport system permease protein